MSDEMAVDLLYGENLAPEKRQRELDFIQAQRDAASGMAAASDPAMKGDMGVLGVENTYNDAHEQAEIADLKEDMGIPDLVGY